MGERKRKEQEEREKMRKQHEEEREKSRADAKEIQKQLNEIEQLRKEEELKEKQNIRQTIKDLILEGESRELTENEKKKLQEFNDTRRLIAYKWWSRCNRPKKKNYITLIATVEDMKYA